MSKKDVLSQAEFEKRIFDLYNGQLMVIGEYKNNKTPIKLKNLVLNEEFETRPDNVLKFKLNLNRKRYTHHKHTETSRNNIKNGKRTANYKSFDKIEEKFNFVYDKNMYELNRDLTKDYINSKENTISLHCKRCGLDFYISYVNMSAGKGCNFCNRVKRQESKNIKLIKEYLSKKNINFTTEYIFEDCKNINNLRFDIAIKTKNSIVVIEYDGEFHDKGYNGNKESALKCKHNDELKNSYCLEHNIPLLRLRYNTFDNYTEKIKKFLIENNIIMDPLVRDD